MIQIQKEGTTEKCLNAKGLLTIDFWDLDYHAHIATISSDEEFSLNVSEIQDGKEQEQNSESGLLPTDGRGIEFNKHLRDTLDAASAWIADWYESLEQGEYRIVDAK